MLLSHLGNVTTTNTFNKCVLCTYVSTTVGLNHARNKANRVSGPGWKSMNGVRAVQPGIMSDTFTIQKLQYEWYTHNANTIIPVSSSSPTTSLLALTLISPEDNPSPSYSNVPTQPQELKADTLTATSQATDHQLVGLHLLCQCKFRHSRHVQMCGIKHNRVNFQKA